MKRPTPPLPHNYLVKIYQMWESGEFPRAAGFHQISIYHDDDCSIFEGKHCNCDPDIRLRATVLSNMN